jgi:hypothetical protein
MIGRLKTLLNNSGSGIDNWFFTERRLGICALGWAFGYAIILSRDLFRPQWWLNPDGKGCTDFIWIWLTSKLALSGSVVRAYDSTAFSAARDAFVGSPGCVLGHLNYPPTVFLFTYPLGLMPYPIAYVVWIVGTILLYLAAVYAIIPRWAAVIAAITPYPVFMNILLGHNGFLTAGLIGLALALMERRPWLSGIFLGLLTYKPQLGILFPLALLASRNWRVLLSATTASVVIGLMAAITFGSQVWPSFLDALTERGSSLNGDSELSLFLLSVFGFLRSVGISANISWTAQLAVTGVVAVIVFALWTRPIPHSLKAAAIAIGSVLAAPHAFCYDFCILSIAVAFLVKDGLARGFLPLERPVMLSCWVGLVLLVGPFPAIICGVLLVLVVRRSVLLQPETLPTPSEVFQIQGSRP